MSEAEHGVAEARHEVDSSQDPAESNVGSDRATMNVTTVDEIESVRARRVRRAV